MVHSHRTINPDLQTIGINSWELFEMRISIYRRESPSQNLLVFAFSIYTSNNDNGNENFNQINRDHLHIWKTGHITPHKHPAEKIAPRM